MTRGSTISVNLEKASEFSVRKFDNFLKIRTVCGRIGDNGLWGPGAFGMALGAGGYRFGLIHRDRSCAS